MCAQWLFQHTPILALLLLTVRFFPFLAPKTLLFLQLLSRPLDRENQRVHISTFLSPLIASIPAIPFRHRAARRGRLLRSDRLRIPAKRGGEEGRGEDGSPSFKEEQNGDSSSFCSSPSGKGNINLSLRPPFATPEEGGRILWHLEILSAPQNVCILCQKTE